MLHIEVIAHFVKDFKPLQTNGELKKILKNYLVKNF